MRFCLVREIVDIQGACVHMFCDRVVEEQTESPRFSCCDSIFYVKYHEVEIFLFKNIKNGRL